MENERIVKFPPKLKPLFSPARYKIFYGGRGGAKSWGFARALLLMGAERSLRILCARETQKSIADSVHQLLSDQIRALGLEAVYDVEKARIKGRNGTLFLFGGLRNDPDALKSVEGCDIVWVEEAQGVSRRSWETLIPTIRKDGSEVWVSFNPELDTDETYKRFVLNPPPSSVVVKLNYTDNPWCPQVLKDEASHLERTDPRAYEHIWLGHCRSAVEGAIYEAEMRLAEAEGRICKVPYNPAVPVHTFWDLGYGDSTTIWYMQQVGYEYHMIDYDEDRQRGIDHYLKLLQGKGYVFGTDYLPHDAANGQLGIGMSIERYMRQAGRSVRVVPRTSSIVNDIAACRLKFPHVYFDTDKCADGLYKLRRYRWGKTSQDQYKREPEHDDASHGADAFRTFGVGYGTTSTPPQVEPIFETPATEYSWMG